MAFGGVPITNGMPNDAEIATRMAVEGAGIIAVASGISRTTVAVLLINAESKAVAKQITKRLSVMFISENGTFAEISFTRPDCSKSLPSVMPPAIKKKS